MKVRIFSKEHGALRAAFRKRGEQATIVPNPLTGLPALNAPDGAPVLRSKDVLEMLGDRQVEFAGAC